MDGRTPHPGHTIDDTNAHTRPISPLHIPTYIQTHREKRRTYVAVGVHGLLLGQGEEPLVQVQGQQRLEHLVEERLRVFVCVVCRVSCGVRWVDGRDGLGVCRV